MSNILRQDQIMKHLLDKKRVLVSELSKALNVTEETIRRDLKNLEQAGRVQRIRGGAKLVDGPSASVSSNLTTKTPSRDEDVRSISSQTKLALRNSKSIMVAGSNLCIEALSFLKKASDLTVVTNSQDLIEKCGTNKYGVKFVCTGGDYDPKTRCFYGTDALRAIARHNVDVTLFSCDVFAEYPTYEQDQSAEIVERMLEQSGRGILLVSNEQFNAHPAAVNGPSYRMFDTVITDMAPPEDWMELFDEHNIEVRFPEIEQDLASAEAEEAEDVEEYVDSAETSAEEAEDEEAEAEVEAAEEEEEEAEEVEEEYVEEHVEEGAEEAEEVSPSTSVIIRR